MAIHDRSGKAANSSRLDELKDGANHFQLLLERIREISDKTCVRFGDDVDGRDYQLICTELESAFRVHVHEGGGANKEGFLRAFSDFMTLNADGFGTPRGWDPLATTARAFPCPGSPQ